jgi:hypothetical protein
MEDQVVNTFAADVSFDTLRSGTRRNHAAPAMGLAKTRLMIALANLATTLLSGRDASYRRADKAPGL